MRVLTGNSAEKNVDKACLQTCESFLSECPVLVLFFCSEKFFQPITEKMHEMFPHSQVVGSTTYASFTSGNFEYDGLKVAAFLDGADVRTGVIGDIDTYPECHKGVIEEATKFVGLLKPK